MNGILANDLLIEITYLIATALFVFSLMWMSSPTTARRGVFAGEIGMVLAIAGTLLHSGLDYTWILIPLVLGTIIGIPLGRVQMTAVPQRTALSHSFGALCVMLVGTAEFYLPREVPMTRFMMAVLCMEVILGALTITGSLMAAGKLQEWLPQRPIFSNGGFHSPVHRDLKPGNVMVTDEGQVKVLGFGLAKLTQREEPDRDATQTLARVRSNLPMSGPTTGSPRWIAGSISPRFATRAENRQFNILTSPLVRLRRFLLT